MKKMISLFNMSTQYPGDPHHYHRSLKGKNYKSFCQERQQRSDGTYKCNFEKREYDLLKDIRAGKIHTCNFVKEESNATILSYFLPEKAEEQVTYEGILTKIAVFVGRRNLSLEAGASEELQSLIKMAIEFGAQESKKNFDVDKVFRKYTEYTVRKYLIAASIEVNKMQFQLFSQLPFVGVACDEGTTKGIHDLDFVMENPLSGLQPYPCYTSVMKNGKAIQYTEHLARGLDFLRINGIPVGSVTVDGNTAQLKALSFTWKNSLRRRYIDHDDFMRRILVNPCLCHKVNNAYKMACKKCPELGGNVSRLRALCSECRQHPNDVKGVCPNVQLQRWIIDYDLASFIIDHADQISKFTTFNIDEIIDLHKLLTILKSLTLIFEDPQTPHFHAFRIIENAIGALEELEKEVQYAEAVKTELIKYCQLSADAGVWMLSYILTPEGRRDFSKRINKKKLPKIPKTGFMPMFKVGGKKEKEDIEELVDFSIENIDIPPNEEDCTNDPINFLTPKEEEENEEEEEEEEENNFQNAFGNEIPEIEEEEDQYEIINEVHANDIQFEEHHSFKCEDIIEEEEETEENNDNDNYQDNDNDNANEKEHSHFVENDEEEEEEEEEGEEDNENSNANINPRLLMHSAQNCLYSILTNWGIISNSREITMIEFNSFVENAKDPYKEQCLKNGDYFWQHIRGINPIWDTLGEIAMRLHCSPCSEASCERTISMQRIVLTARRMSSKKDLLDARLTLLRGINTNEKS